MAEGIAFGLVTEVLSKLNSSGVLSKVGTALGNEIGLLWSFKDDADDLRSNFSAIRAVLLDAEERSSVEKESHSLRDWLRKLKDAAYDADDLLDEIRTQAEKVSGFLSRANPMRLKFKHKMAHRMKELRKKIDKIAKQRHDFGLVEAGPRRQAEFKRPETFSVVDEKEIVGRDNDKEEIVKLLLETGGDHDVSVIPIVGLGGLGKTTLAQLAFNDGRVTADLRVWVCVSIDFNMKTIAKPVIDEAGEKCNDFDNADAVARCLRKIFSEKRFLLVLDDVWNEDQGKWEELKVLFKDGTKGSKILVTTRSEKVAEIMKTTEQPHRLKGLSDEDCWTLFKRRAFKEGEENGYPSLVEIGKQIVKKCGGVPLAAQALGGLMRFRNRTDVTWSAMRDSEIWRLEEEKEILPSLKLSYIHMPSALKQCFAYCSIFPKDYEIDKDDLIQQWIALGFISSPDTSTLMEDIGNDYFNDLLWMSFLQNVMEDDEITCRMRMHDLVHDLAQSVAREEVAVIVGEESTSIPEGCRYASIHSRSIQQVPTTAKQRLRALQFGESASLTTFYSEAKFLRLLALHGFKISMLPSSIGKLKLLRYLNLSRTYIKELPESITGLCNLQTLNLSWCRNICSLPKSLGSLVNLRILNLSNCSRLLSLPSSLCQLKNLHDLNLSDLDDLQGLPESIGNLENLRILNLSQCSSLLSLPSSSSDLQHLEILDICGCIGLCKLPNTIQKMTNFRELLIEDCWELKAMPRGIGKLVSLPKLPIFAVGKQDPLEHCASISELKQLNNLVGELVIKGLENVTNPVDAKAADLIEKKLLRSLELKWNVLSAAEEDMDTVQPPAEEMDAVLENLQPHQNLEKLVIKGYAGGKFPSWMIDSCLPKLVEIELVNIPRCSSLPPLWLLPVLKRLTIRNMAAITNLGVEFDGDSHINESANKFPALSRLDLSDMPTKLKNLGMEGCSSLRYLSIEDCPLLFNAGGDVRVNERPEPCLPSSVDWLEISGISKECLSLILKCPTMDSETPPVDGDVVSLQQPNMMLQHLEIKKCQQLTCLPEGLRSFTSLEYLTIEDCEDLERIEDWLGELTKLQYLYIWSCQSLRYLPAHKMTTLQLLNIKDCPLLFNADDGQFVDTNVDHIEHVYVDRREYRHKKQVSSSSQEEEKKSWTGCWGKLDWSERRA